jgi:glycosyltransferase involved in cell wall biosynthesis
MEDDELKGAALACRAIEVMNSKWPWSAAKRPRLIMRGFSDAEVDREIAAIGEPYQSRHYLFPRPYTADANIIANEICSSSAVIMPSKREAFGLVALEGVAAGIPVVMTSESGIGEIIMEHATIIGQTLAEACVADVEGDDPVIADDWANKMRAIMIDPPAAFAQAEILREALKPHLNWHNAVVKFTHDFEEILI